MLIDENIILIDNFEKCGNNNIILIYENTNLIDKYGGRDYNYGKRDPNYGKRDYNYGKRDPNYGKRDYNYGKRDPN
ncbi:MAG: hypothetical protein LBT50_07485, partial [Prevotellaceae bacterium]|nr:hypothetical protein [Prevotellaceae bacterium]